MNEQTDSILNSLLPGASAALANSLVQAQSLDLRLSRALLTGLDAATRLRFGKPLQALPESQQQAWLDQLSRTPLVGVGIQALVTPLRLRYLDQPEIIARTGQRLTPEVPAQLETPRWQQQISRPADWAQQETLEADVVVVGSGAGGAAAAYELASHGLAVLILEEGDYLDRQDFADTPKNLIRRIYRNQGMTAALGNTLIPVPLGRCVGGTTTINSGTCIRTPDAILQAWQQEGLTMLSSAGLSEYFAEVENILGVQPGTAEAVGPIAEVIRRGAEKLGLTQSHPLNRNAIGCDGQGLCQFGCPTGAKQSTNVSYIPRALARGAQLITGYRVTRLARSGASITGLTAQAADGKQLQVSARAVVLAMGSLLTPAFMQQQGFHHHWLGRNLSLHPAGAVSAWFPDRDFRNSRTIPQGFGVADLAAQGILLEGATPPLAALGAMLPQLGSAFTRQVDRYAQTAFFGFMIRDDSRGRVRHLPGAAFPWVSYRMQPSDFARFKQGLHWLSRIFFAAGAASLHLPGYRAIPEITSMAQVETILRKAKSPRDFFVSAYHPLGTCRMAVDAAHGVIDPTHRVFGTHNLYVMDGSSLPSSLGANPQITIMALAQRGARLLARRLLDEDPCEHPGQYHTAQERSA